VSSTRRHDLELMSSARSDAMMRQSAGWLALSIITAGVANFFYSIVLTWLLPPRDYSAFASGQALLLVCGTASTASVTWVLARLISRGSTALSRQAALSFAVMMSLTQGLVAALVAGLVAFGFLGGWFPWVVGLAAVAIFQAATAVGFLQGTERFSRIAMLRVGEVVLKIAAGFGLIRLGAGAAGAMAGFAIGALLVFVVGMGRAIKQIRFRLEWLLDRENWAQMLGLAAIQTTVALLTNLDLILAGLMVHDTGYLSGYQVSVMLSRIPIFLATAVSMPVFTRLTASRALGVPVVKGSLSLFVRSTLPVALAIGTLPLPLASIFLPGHYPARVEAFLPYTATAGILAAATNLLSTYFQAQSRFANCFWLLATGLVVDGLAIIAGFRIAGPTGLAVGSVIGQLTTTVLLLASVVRIWGRWVLPARPVMLSALASAPLLALRPVSWLWFGYGMALALFTAWSTFWRGRVTKASKTTLSDSLDFDLPTGGVPLMVPAQPSRLLRIYLLTSHPVAPPWNGSEKNMARDLLDAEMPDVEYTFIGESSDKTAWPKQHRRRALRFATGAPTRREMLYLYGHLLVDKYEGDLVHTIITFGPSAISESALLALRLLRRHPIVATCPSGNYLPLRLLRRAEAVIAVSRYTQAKLHAAGVPNVHHIPPGVDLARFQPKPDTEAKAALQVGPGPALLFAGHYDGGGGVEAALELLRRVKSSLPSAYLLLAMRGHANQDLVYASANMRARAASLGVLDSIVELGPEADMPLALQASTAVIFQPRRMGAKIDLPLTLLEALASGRPIIVSTLPTLTEIADGSPAVMVAEKPDEAVAEHVRRLACDPAYQLMCSAAARRLAETRYSVAPMTAAYAAVYRQTLRHTAGLLVSSDDS
jgi:O-antigen/teichoic acid export membrane protein